MASWGRVCELWEGFAGRVRLNSSHSHRSHSPVTVPSCVSRNSWIVLLRLGKYYPRITRNTRKNSFQSPTSEPIGLPAHTKQRSWLDACNTDPRVEDRRALWVNDKWIQIQFSNLREILNHCTYTQKSFFKSSDIVNRPTPKTV